MLLTRSIRRKLFTALLAVAFLFGLFVTVSLRGVISYRRTVKDLEISIASAPSSEQLVALVSSLLTPFTREMPPESAPLDLQADVRQRRTELFLQTLARTKERFKKFDQAWKFLPASLRFDSMHEMAFNKLLDHVDLELRHIEARIDLLQSPEHHREQEVEITKAVGRLVEKIQRVPDPSHVLGERLAAAQADYRYYFGAVITTAILSFSVLGWLIFWGNKLISTPIRRLLQGVSRVAAGDFDHEIPTQTNCEVSHLANAFNKMTLRIRNDQADKQRQIEERSKQLVQSERLAGVGFLAAGVAHEINNPLTAIMSAAEVLQYRLADVVAQHMNQEDACDVQEYLKMIVTEAQRCATITKKLLDFSHGGGQERNLYDVTAIVHEVVSMVRHLGKFKNRKLAFERTEPLRAWINGPEIKQVILNLVANGLDATEKGGDVRVTLREHPDQIEVEIADTGVGMTEDQLHRLFQPFVTTKGVGKGTGLGLSISQRIVMDHGGTLEASSPGPGQGSTFRLRLPLSAAAANRAAA